MEAREVWVMPAAEADGNLKRSLAGLCNALNHWNARFVSAASASESVPAVILLAHQGWPPFISTLKSCRRRWRAAPVVGLVPVEELQPEPLRQAYLEGLQDFVPAPVRVPELDARLRCLTAADGIRPLGAPDDLAGWKQRHNLEALVGSSRPFEQALRRIPTLSATDTTVLILGETGTGKELFARALHYLSRRKAAPFVPVNCGALPDSLFENELFGHARGAYTDARAEAAGLLPVAEGGSLFLDEVDSLSPQSQVKLLRLLQSREYRPLGSAHTRVADIRIIAAANVDLEKLVREHRLREDLYYRLNVLRILVPPLRERPGDVLQLAEHFLETMSRERGRPRLRLGSAAALQLSMHRWPGNVRELEAVMQRAVLMCSGPVLQTSDLELGPEPLLSEDAALESGSLKHAKAAVIEQFERSYLLQLLERCGGNVSQAARAARKERRAFQRLLHKRGIQPRAAGQVG